MSSTSSNLPAGAKTLARSAAGVCLAMPLLAIILSVVYSLVAKELKPGHAVIGALAVGGLWCLCILVSLLAGLLALVMMRSGDWAAVLWRAFLGLGLSGG